MLSEKLKLEILNMSLKEMLTLWRFSPVGSPMFQGEIGEFFQKVMTDKRNADPALWTRVSKEIGW